MDEQLSYAEVPPTDAEILGVLVDHFDVEPQEVIRWLDSFNADAARRQLCLDLGIAKETAP